MNNVYILEGSRTPVGAFMGEISSLRATELGSESIKGTFKKISERSNGSFDLNQFEKIYMGNVLSAGVGQAPARQAALFAGCSESIEALTINKVCGSGLQSVISAAKDIRLGETSLAIAGGMESMSNVPHLLQRSRFGFKYGNFTTVDSLEHDGLWDIYSQRVMGLCAEECVEKYSISREDQDIFAIESYKRAQKATEDGHFLKEISPLEIKSKKSIKTVDKDESIYQVNFEKLLKLSSVFKKDGTITPANASSINDGAATVFLTNEEYKKYARFRIVDWASHAHNPTWFTTAPVMAMEKLLKKSKISKDDIGVFEINEAFSLVAMHAINELKLNHDKVNIFGGAVSIGHPIGASGCRILVTLMNAMDFTNSNYGIASICIGGGEGLALLLEKL